MTTPGSKFGSPIEMVPGSANNIIILARAGKREHLEALQKGKMRASHIGNYKKEEDRGKPFFDENEAVDAIFDPEKIVIKLKKDDQEIAELIPIENVREFHNRFNIKANELGIAIRHGLVEYQDLNAIHGKIPSNKWGLVKDLSYSEEREYRYIFISKERLPDPYFFEVGDLTDISQVMPMDQFKKFYQVTIEYENNGEQKSGVYSPYLNGHFV